MKIQGIALLLLIVLGVCSTPPVLFSQTTVTRSPEITVDLVAPIRTVSAGEPIHLNVRVSNTGDSPTLVSNNVSMASGGTAFLRFELKDTRGHVSPAMELIADYLPPTAPSEENAAARLLSSWALLYPQTSLLFDISIDQSLFKVLGKPGKYKLSATYASGGISYGRNRIGITDDVLSSLPFPSWSGKVSTNEISLTVVAPKNTKR